MADPVIDEIKQRIDIADLVSGTVQLKKAGRGLKGLCPFHQEKSPSFHVYPDQGTYHCFGCGKSGDAFTWLQETEHLDFGEALRQLADRTGVRLPERTAPRPDPAVQAAVDALTEAATWFHDQLRRAPDAAPAREYLQRRGVQRETVEGFRLGWAPDRWDVLTGHLRQRGFATEQIEGAGLALAGERGLHDRFRARVMFPIRDPEGKVTGFGGRTLGDGQPKYLNSPQTAMFDKSATLYALDLAKAGIRKAGQAVIVEGYMDVVLPHQAGFTNVVASLGTALTERQIELLRRYTGTIVLALDADAAGQAATLRGLEVARQALLTQRRPVPGRATRTGYLSLSAGQVKIAVLQGGKDPDEIVRESPAAWQRLVDGAVPMMDHKVEVELGRVDPQDPQSKTAAVQELARFLVQVPDPIEWGHYIDRIAQRLRLDLRAVRDEVDRAARALREEQRRRQQRQQTSPPGRSTDAQPPAGGAPERRTAADGPEPQRRTARRDESGGSATAVSPDSQGAPPEGALPQRSATQGAPRQGDSSSRNERPARTPDAPVPRRSEGAGGTGDVTEEHLVSLLMLAPHLVRRLPSRLTPEDFRRPECRELYRAVLAAVESQERSPSTGDSSTGAPPESGPGAATIREPSEYLVSGIGAPPGVDPIGSRLDVTLLGYYDRVRGQARREPYHTESQLEAAVVGVVRRIRERNLKEELREAQYLLQETNAGEDRGALERRVERLAAQLGRVQLERSRAALYTPPPG